MRFTRPGAAQTPSGVWPNRSAKADRTAASADIAQELGGPLRGDVVDEHSHGRLAPGQVLELAGRPADREHLEEQVGQIVAHPCGRLLPAGDVWHLGAEDAVEAVQDVQVQL